MSLSFDLIEVSLDNGNVGTDLFEVVELLPGAEVASTQNLLNLARRLEGGEGERTAGQCLTR